MKYKLDQLIKFGKENINFFEEKYEMFLAKPEENISKKVVSIRPGFSNSGGQIMLVDKIDGDNIRLISCEESSMRSGQQHSGWGCSFEERVNSFIFYKQSTIK